MRTAEGEELIDYVGTWRPAILGHAHPAVVAAVQAAAARGFTGRDAVAKFDGFYHGHGDSLLVREGSGALTLGTPDSAGVPAGLAGLTHVVPFNDVEALEDLFRRHGSDLAAVILELVPANAGLYVPRPGFLSTLRDLCTRHGVLLIADEVMTGFRLAPGGAQEIFGIVPDLTCLGKIIGGGLPVGAFGGRADIMDRLAPLGPVYQAGTHSGNPLAMAAGIATLDDLERCGGHARLEELGRALEAGMLDAARATGIPLQWRRLGSMFCAYFTDHPVWNLSDALRSDRARFARFFHGMLSAGVYIAPSQFEAGFLSTAHTADDIQRTIDAARAAMGGL